MKFEPVGNRVLIEQVKAKQKTDGGIILPDVAQEVPQIGTVVALGKILPEVTINTTIKRFPFKEGDKVLYEAFAGTKICLDDKKYIVLDAESILGVISETD
jgi:chaperonin GroES